MISLKKLFWTCCLSLSVLVAFAQDASAWKALEKPVNFLLANDLGRNGYYDQKPIAELMGQLAENVDIEAVVAAGDVHHFEGVRSVNDPLWMTNYELIYSHPELMIPWYPILGNHEYRGNTQAVLDYAQVSARWEMPARYYTKVLENDDVTVRLVMIDTAPLLDKYRKDVEKYPDACRQDMDKQLAWIDSVLTAAKEDWVLVVGHHPIFADTDKSDAERLDMEKRVDSILRKHKNVNMYLCGHIHNFQYIRKPGSAIDYVVNSSGSLSRKVKAVDGTQFCSGESGFSLVSADEKELCLHMINKDGKVIYTVRQTR
ncbi:metallophosphoesterase [Bacteroides mediterraneensis]|uniref:metallophosphoesterase n=1 Tax=Bacteroides mediterraneensis TaxID=1841856 RepID=UPI0019597FBF|nr:metallophosphoesterase [Bacteroides mediterraneensis]MBM6780517.1 metallophosphoesterase [Bacteroides mediterraneensis]